MLVKNCEDNIISLYDYTPYNRGKESSEIDKHIMNIKNCKTYYGEEEWKNDKRKESISFFF